MKPLKKFLSIICIITLIVPLFSAFTLDAAAKEESTTKELSSSYKAKTIKLTGTKGKNKKEVAALKKIWEENSMMPENNVTDLNDDFYSWNSKGRLIGFGKAWKGDESDYSCPLFNGKISFGAFPKLKRLVVHGDIKSLDVGSNKNLTELDCSYSSLTELDISSNTNLTGLFLLGSNLTELDLRNNTELTLLSCEDNKLTKLDLSNNTKLETVWCGNNELTELNLGRNNNMKYLFCRDNKLTTLDISNCKNLEEFGHDVDVKIIGSHPNLRY